MLLAFIWTRPAIVGFVPLTAGRAMVFAGGEIPIKVSKLVVLPLLVAPCPMSHCDVVSVTPTPEVVVPV